MNKYEAFGEIGWPGKKHETGRVTVTAKEENGMRNMTNLTLAQQFNIDKHNRQTSLQETESHSHSKRRWCNEELTNLTLAQEFNIDKHRQTLIQDNISARR